MQNENMLNSTIQGLSLSKYALRYESTSKGKKFLQSIPLEHLSSSQMYYVSKPTYIILSIITIILATALSYPLSNGFKYEEITASVLAIGGAISIALILLYFFTRTAHLIFSSNSLRIELVIKELDMESVQETIDTVESAKANLKSS